MVESTESVLGKRTRKVAFGGEKKPLPEKPKPEAIWEVRNGLRFVIPYDHEFKAFAKRRWVGQPLIEVFCAEFKAFKASYYGEAIANGNITVNLNKVDKMYKIKEGDQIIHKTHREETPILA